MTLLPQTREQMKSSRSTYPHLPLYKCTPLIYIDTMKTKQKFVFQGDVPFAPFTGKITGEIIKHSGSVVLALGEQTGHKHVITVPKIDDMEARRLPDGGWILTLKSEGTVTHEEHGQIIVAPGVYRVGKERELDHFANSVIRKVVD